MDYDKDVIARAIRRDADAFAEIYTKTSPQVFRYIYYIVGNRQEADDLTSDVFLHAWQAIDRYEERGAPISSWLLRIGHNLTLKHLGRRRPRVSLEDIDLQEDERHSPESILAVAVDAQVIRRAILALPDTQRQVIVCRFIEHMTYEEVEAMVGKSPGAVRVLQHRALRKLREMIAVSGKDTGRSLREPRLARSGA